MTVKRWVIVAMVLLGVVIFGGLGWFGFRLYNRAEKFEALYYGCLTAPSDSTTRVMEKPVLSQDTLRPLPLRHWVKTIIVHDTIFRTDTTKKVEVNFYSDTYRKDGLQINYEAIAEGELKSIRFPSIVYPQKIVTITQRIPHHDTLTINLEKSHLGIYAKVAAWDRIYGFGSGIQYSYRGKWSVAAGIQIQNQYRTDGTKYLQPISELGIVVNIN